MSRLVSFVVLVAVILVVAVLFFRVILEFVVPMFLAAVLVVVFRPMHKWFEYKLAGRPRVAAAATTVCITLIVLVPIVAIGWNAYLEVTSFARDTLAASSADQTPPEQPAAETSPSGPDSGEQSDREGRAADEALAEGWSEFESRMDHAIGAVIRSLEGYFGIGVAIQASEIRRMIVDTAENWFRGGGGGAAIAGAQWILRTLFRLIVGLAIMIISVYFFLADGPGMIVTIMHLSPLEDRYELELLHKFANVSRSVVVATLLSAFVQGVLAGIGYQLAGFDIVFTLTGLTMLLAVVPFLGAASVWAPTSAWLFLGEERTAAAIMLALYGLTVVSTIDNFIKPYVLHGQSNLHPLLALLSVLGGVAAMGPIGILVGPMAVAFLQALLGMLRREIDEMGGEGKAPKAVRALSGVAGSKVQASPPESATNPADNEVDSPSRKPSEESAAQPKQSTKRTKRRKRK